MVGSDHGVDVRWEDLFGPSLTAREALKRHPFLEDLCKYCTSFWQKGTTIYTVNEDRVLILHGCGCDCVANSDGTRPECIFGALEEDLSYRGDELPADEFDELMKEFHEKKPQSTNKYRQTSPANPSP